jgi:hypothetical protein
MEGKEKVTADREMEAPPEDPEKSTDHDHGGGSGTDKVSTCQCLQVVD